MPEDKSLIDFLLDVNDTVKLATDKSLIELGGRIEELFGAEVAQKITRWKPASPGSPYAVLGVRPGASTFVIRGTYRKLTRDKSLEETKELREAYAKILSERGEG